MKELPIWLSDGERKETIRHFPDKLPMGVAAKARVFAHNSSTPVDFRAFLHRHAELLEPCQEWELRLLVPRHMVKAVALAGTSSQEMTRPLRLDDAAELHWYFRQQDQVDRGGAQIQALPACM